MREFAKRPGSLPHRWRHRPSGQPFHRCGPSPRVAINGRARCPPDPSNTRETASESGRSCDDFRADRQPRLRRRADLRDMFEKHRRLGMTKSIDRLVDIADREKIPGGSDPAGAIAANWYPAFHPSGFHRSAPTVLRARIKSSIQQADRFFLEIGKIERRLSRFFFSIQLWRCADSLAQQNQQPAFHFATIAAQGAAEAHFSIARRPASGAAFLDMAEMHTELSPSENVRASLNLAPAPETAGPIRATPRALPLKVRPRRSSVFQRSPRQLPRGPTHSAWRAAAGSSRNPATRIIS